MRRAMAVAVMLKCRFIRFQNHSERRRGYRDEMMKSNSEDNLDTRQWHLVFEPVRDTTYTTDAIPRGRQ